MLVQRNTYFNFVGHAIVAMAALLATPFYLHFLGAQAFGLVGVMYTATAIVAIFDPGLTAVSMRELARLSEDSSNDRGVLVFRCLERVCAVVCVIAVLGLSWCLPLFSENWLSSHNLPIPLVAQCMSWIGVHAGLQLLIVFYAGGLQGLQKQLSLNMLLAGWALARAMIAVLGLALGWFGIVGFFVCQVLLSLVQILMLRYALWRVMPRYTTGVDWTALVSLRRFALGMWGSSALAVALTQIDKLVLSHTMSLESFGYYILIWNVAMLIIKPAQPVYNAYLPHLSQLAAKSGSDQELAQAYHQACKRNTAYIWPLAIFVALFSYYILRIYTGNESLASQASMALSILVVGSALNATMLMPYALIQAHGWVSFSMLQNLIACFLILPLAFWASLEPGLERAALCWLVINLGYVLVSIPLMHRRLLPGHVSRWYLQDNYLQYFLPRQYRISDRSS